MSILAIKNVDRFSANFHRKKGLNKKKDEKMLKRKFT